jgi:hypothetical protein
MDYLQPSQRPPQPTIADLKGLTLRRITGLHDEGSEVIFYATCVNNFMMSHDQECCEEVYIESVVGTVADLLGEPLLVAEQVSSDGHNEDWGQWTFYRLATRKGFVVIRWLGKRSYYSTDVTIRRYTGK